MGRMARVVIPGCAHHVLQRTVQAIDAFHSEADREDYIALMAEQGRTWGVEFLAYCLMNDHVHLVALPSSEEGLARAVGEAHRRYTRSLNMKLGVRGYLFHGRFSSCPLDPDYLVSAIRYVERNPVRSGLAAEAWRYRWSSAAYRVGERERDALVRARNLAARTLPWRTLLAEEPNDVPLLRERTRTGRPCGSAEFVYHAEVLTGRTLRPLPPGRPRKSKPPATPMRVSARPAASGKEAAVKSAVAP